MLTREGVNPDSTGAPEDGNCATATGSMVWLHRGLRHRRPAALVEPVTVAAQFIIIKGIIANI